MDYFITFNDKDAAAAEQAKNIGLNLAGKADNFTGASNRKGRLIEADFLIVIFNSDEDFANDQIVSDFTFFDNEMRWKRKNGGQILLFVPEDLNFSKLPYKLKNCYYFNFGEQEPLAEFMREQREISASGSNFKAKAQPTGTSGKAIVYVPHDTSVQQIKYNDRAPSVPSFDGKINYDTRIDSEACRDNHVKSAGKGLTNKHIVEELERPTIISERADNLNKGAKRKQTSGGCVLSIIIGVLLISILIIIFAVVIPALGSNSLQSITSVIQTPQSPIQAITPSTTNTLLSLILAV